MIFNMRSLTSMKEMQKLAGRIATLSKSLSCVGNKFIHFIVTLKKS